ncbi:MAG: substrate-binding domain-containing protein [Kiritimatiellae bacterium]|nr:substrate-binding domain-containing protein [Kiritimatiellia bacterium]
MRNGLAAETSGNSSAGNTVLYLHFVKNPVMHGRFLDGMRRFARTAGWNVVPLQIDGLSQDQIRDFARKNGAIGYVRDSGWPKEMRRELPLSALRLPVVFEDPRESVLDRHVGAVFSDNAAIAKAAFRELSAGHPPSYAAVGYWDHTQRWGVERIAAFRSFCAEAGFDCPVFRQSRREPAEKRMKRLEKWVAALPEHVAVFCANDFTAIETAIALRSRHRPVPKSATVVGVDGSPERDDIVRSPVPISSVNVNFESAGFHAARLLAEEIAARAAGARPAARTAVFGPLMVERRESTHGRGRRERFILEAAETIRREACNGLTAAALAARFPVSRKHFERRFREAIGHSVLDEILNVRLESVMAYLLRRDVAIDAIAGLCGFGSEIELRRLFRRRFGMSMTSWRARNST